MLTKKTRAKTKKKTINEKMTAAKKRRFNERYGWQFEDIIWLGPPKKKK